MFREFKRISSLASLNGESLGNYCDDLLGLLKYRLEKRISPPGISASHENDITILTKDERISALVCANMLRLAMDFTDAIKAAAIAGGITSKDVGDIFDAVVTKQEAHYGIPDSKSGLGIAEVPIGDGFDKRIIGFIGTLSIGEVRVTAQNMFDCTVQKSHDPKYPEAFACEKFLRDISPHGVMQELQDPIMASVLGYRYLQSRQYSEYDNKDFAHTMRADGYASLVQLEFMHIFKMTHQRRQEAALGFLDESLNESTKKFTGFDSVNDACDRLDTSNEAVNFDIKAFYKDAMDRFKGKMNANQLRQTHENLCDKKADKLEAISAAFNIPTSRSRGDEF